MASILSSLDLHFPACQMCHSAVNLCPYLCRFVYIFNKMLKNLTQFLFTFSENWFVAGWWESVATQGVSLVTLSNLLTKYPIKCYCSNPCFFLFETCCLMSSFWHLNYRISHPSEIEIKKDNMKPGSPFLSFIQRDNLFSTVLLRHIFIYY